MKVLMKGFDRAGQVRDVSEAEATDLFHYGLAEPVDTEERGVTIAPLPSEPEDPGDTSYPEDAPEKE